MSLSFFLWSFPVILTGKWWWRWCYGMGIVEEDERVIERSVCCMERKWKKKRKERSRWVAGQESEDIYEMCGWGERGRRGHTCGSLKYLTSHPFFFFTLELSWGITREPKVLYLSFAHNIMYLFHWTMKLVHSKWRQFFSYLLGAPWKTCLV